MERYFFGDGRLGMGKEGEENVGSLILLSSEHKEHPFPALRIYQTNNLVVKESELWHHFNKA